MRLSTMTGCMFAAGMAVCALAVLPASAQVAAGPATQPGVVEVTPGTQPVVEALPEGAQEIQARVIEVRGRAQHAPVGTAVTDKEAWQPVQAGDLYPAGTLIRTGLSSHVTLQLGGEAPFTVVMVERMSLASIASLFKTQTDKVSRVTVNYGAVRGGVSEGGLRSSFVVDSTVATLTKRGTWGFRMFVERGTGRYEVSLADTGLIEALNNITRERQSLASGQYVTEAMRRWVDQASFDRLITLQDRFGMTNEEFQFKAFHNTGYAVMDPASSANVYSQARPGWQAFVSEQVQLREQQLAGQQEFLQRLRDVLNPPRPGVIDRPEGDFNSRFR